MIYFIGTGLNLEENFSGKSLEIIKKSDLIIGFRHSLRIPKLINTHCEFVELEIFDSLKPERIDELIGKMKLKDNCAVCVGGSPLFFSYSRKITSKLDEKDYEVVTSPSSIEYLAEKLRTDLNDLSILSGHNSHDLVGTRNTAVKLLSMGRKIGYFVKNEEDMVSLLDILSFHDVSIKAGFELGSDREAVININPGGIFRYEHGRWILLITPGDGFKPLKIFPKNEKLKTDNIPVSREWSRALAVHELEPESSRVIWDIGAGSGATSIWISSLIGTDFTDGKGRIYAIEKDRNRYELLCENIGGYPNIIPVSGDYADIVQNLPTPDGLLIGGGIDEYRIEKLFSVIPSGTKFVSALTTMESVAIIKKIKGIETSCDMYSKSCSRELGSKTAFVGEHVFFLLKGEKL